MNKKKTIVNSWNEWDPLKHVIVGRADGCCIPAPEPALDAKVPEDSDMKGQYGPRTKDTVDKANELLNNFASLLEKKGIKVDRPVPLDFNQEISTPDWKAKSMFGFNFIFSRIKINSRCRITSFIFNRSNRWNFLGMDSNSWNK